MSLIRWFTRNWANTREPTHPDLGPLVVHAHPLDAMATFSAVIVNHMPRWDVVDQDGPANTLHATRTTRWLRFIDDVRLTFEPGPRDGTSTVHAESRSRVGIGDLGQNRRNILELWRVVHQVGVTDR